MKNNWLDILHHPYNELLLLVRRGTTMVCQTTKFLGDLLTLKGNGEGEELVDHSTLSL